MLYVKLRACGRHGCEASAAVSYSPPRFLTVSFFALYTTTLCRFACWPIKHMLWGGCSV